MNSRWLIRILILAIFFLIGCGSGDEEILDLNMEDQRIRDEVPEVMVREPENWICFNPSAFHSLITYGKYDDRRLTYEDFYQKIDYRLMMEEEKVLEIFGSPNQRVEEIFAYQMYILEYEGLIIHVNDYDHGVYATGYHIRSPKIPGPRGTFVGQSVGDVLLAYPLPKIEDYTQEEWQIRWGNETQYYGAYMAAINHSAEGEIMEVRYAESTGFAGVVYEIFEGVVQSIYFFEMN